MTRIYFTEKAFHEVEIMRKNSIEKQKRPQKPFFILSLRMSTLKLAAVTAVSLGILFLLITLIPSYVPDVTNSIYTGTENVRFNKIRTNTDRVDFLEQFGWTVYETPIEEKKVEVPSEFDKVMLSYNELQRSQGLDLNKYRGKELMRYTYEVTNYPDHDGRVLANVLVYRNRVVGGDICSSESGGFIQTFIKTK